MSLCDKAHFTPRNLKQRGCETLGDINQHSGQSRRAEGDGKKQLYRFVDLPAFDENKKSQTYVRPSQQEKN